MTWKGKGDGKGIEGRVGRGGKTIHGNEGEAIGDMDWEVQASYQIKLVGVLLKYKNSICGSFLS